MNQNSMAIIALCSHLCKGNNVKPLEPAEWTKLADRMMDNGISPSDLFSYTSDDYKSKLGFTTDEIKRLDSLIERSGSIAFEIEKYANMGIKIMTRADIQYPRQLKRKLGRNCPPIFYYAGDPEITNKRCIGFTGSRNVSVTDEDFTAATVRKVNANSYSVVSGGAKGVDSTSCATSISSGNCCIEYISDSLINRIKPRAVVNAVINKQLLILSVVKPDSGFSAGVAMMRNKFIYAQSEGTVIVRSDFNKGGTWSGGVSNLKQQLSVTFCWNNTEYKGNVELIKRGAIPIDETWDGDVINHKAKQEVLLEQFSLFD